MSNNNQQKPDTSAAAANIANTTPQQTEKPNAKAQRAEQIRAELVNIDNTDGNEARVYLQKYSALHADPNPDAELDGKKADEYLKLFNEKSAAVAKKKEGLENELNQIMGGLGAIASKEELDKLRKERAEASKRAVQEPFKDNSAFANPELDKIRNELQKNPLPGGDKASIDDGTGGETQPNTPTTEQKAEAKKA